MSPLGNILRLIFRKVFTLPAFAELLDWIDQYKELISTLKIRKRVSSAYLAPSIFNLLSDLLVGKIHYTI